MHARAVICGRYTNWQWLGLAAADSPLSAARQRAHSGRSRIKVPCSDLRMLEVWRLPLCTTPAADLPLLMGPRLAAVDVGIVHSFTLSAAREPSPISERRRAGKI